jgi:ABC-type branched-subunit amino acid transport system substrate-binding protein
MYLNARRSLAIVASAALLTVAAACTSNNSSSPTPTGSAAANDPGISATEITLGTHQPLTGVAAAGYSKISASEKAYFAYINAKFGGVNGRKINYIVKDDAYNPSNTNTVVRELVEKDNVFAIVGGLGTPTHSNVVDYLKSKKVPDLFVASGAPTWNNPTKYPTTFAVQPDYVSEGTIVGTYIKANEGGKKTCFFGQGDDFGDSYLAGLQKGLGADVTAKASYQVTNANVGAQVGQLKAAGCQVTVLATIPPFTAAFIGTGAALGFKTQYYTAGVGADYQTVAAVLKGDPTHLLQGMISAGYLPSVMDANDPWNQYFKKINDAYNGGATYDGQVLYGMAVAWLTVQALTKAGPNLTRQGLVDAIESGTLTKGPSLVPLIYSKTQHAGWVGARLAKVDGTTQNYFGPTYTLDASGAVTTFTQGPDAPPSFQA